MDGPISPVRLSFRDIVIQRRLGAPHAVFGNARGALSVWAFPAQGTLVSSASGHGSLEFVRPFLDEVEAATAKGVREIWDDWADIHSYDSAARVEITEWTKARPDLAKNIHVLVGSKLVAMGVNLANLALGKLFEVTADRAQFERELRLRL